MCEFLAVYKLGCAFRSDEDWLFPAERDEERPVNGWNLQQRFLRPAAQAAGLGESIGFHSLRHTYSTMLRDLGVDLKVQQELMRHADIRTTMNVYTQAVGDSLRAAQSMVTRSMMTGRIQ